VVDPQSHGAAALFRVPLLAGIATEKPPLGGLSSFAIYLFVSGDRLRLPLPARAEQTLADEAAHYDWDNQRRSRRGHKLAGAKSSQCYCLFEAKGDAVAPLGFVQEHCSRSNHARG